MLKIFPMSEIFPFKKDPYIKGLYELFRWT